MNEAINCIVAEILAIAKKYNDLYKAAKDLVDDVETFQFTNIYDYAPAMEMLERHIDKIATIVKEQRQ